MGRGDRGSSFYGDDVENGGMWWPVRASKAATVERERVAAMEREIVDGVPDMPEIDFLLLCGRRCRLLLMVSAWCFEVEKQCRAACINNLPRS